MQGVVQTHYISINGDKQQQIDAEVVEEALACISLNGSEVATFMCSPHQLDKLAIGFLYNEGFINSMADIHHLRVSKKETCVDVWLKDTSISVPERQITTAGCGGGVTFDDLSQKHEPLDIDLAVSASELATLMRQLHLGATLYQRSRGIHTAALADTKQLLLQVEDIGRHNCLDKLRGAALVEEIETHGRILISSGRISSEMLNKARRLQTPIVCSRTSPTSMSVALAQAWNITIVAYLRQDRMRVYTHPERIYETAHTHPVQG